MTPAGRDDPGEIARDPDRLSRRAFLGGTAPLASVGAIAPFSFVRSSRAGTLRLARFVREQRRLTITPGISVAVVRGEETVFSTGAGWADRAILQLLYGSGLRVSELTGLDRDGLDLRRGTVLVMGKGSIERSLPMSEPAVDAVRAWLRTEPDPLWPNARGGPMSPRDVRRVLERRAPGMRPHLLRHASATNSLEGGAGLREVQEFLGHSSPTTTERYTHVTRGRKFAVYGAAHPRA